MKIHFVCRGNVHRSRLIEAYAKSLHLNNILVSSSGIDADFHYPVDEVPQDFLGEWAVLTAKEHGLDLRLTPARTQTTSKILENQDFIVFVSQDVYKDAVIRYTFNKNNCAVWDLKDIADWNEQNSQNRSDEQKRDFTFSRMKEELAKLLTQLEIE